MKKLILIALLGLAACAKPNNQTQAATEPTREVKSLSMNAQTCQEIAASVDQDYFIQTKTDVFVLKSGVLYAWNQEINKMDVVADGVILMSDICNFTIQNGVVSKIELVRPPASSCGGIFQPSCPPPQPQPYPCGPNGQMCY